jgi:tripartite-type tricarboxylate transporter receptor subunit TctC
MKSVLRFTSLGLFVVALLSAVGGAFGQTYPTKPVELIVAFAPGSGNDMSARLVAAYAAKKWGVSVNVLNVTGASGVTAMLQVLNARPDGYTLLMDGNVTSSFMFASRTDLPVKIEDRTYAVMATSDPAYFFANTKTGWKRLEEAIQFLKTKPEQFIWGAGAYGSSPMFSQVELFTAAGVSMDTIKKSKMVVFEKGNTPSLQACVVGDVLFCRGEAGNVESLLATGRIVVLGVNSPERTKQHPNIPTTREAGFPDATMVLWYGISGPKELPDNVVKAWDTLLKGTASDPEAQALAEKSMRNWSYRSTADYRDYVMQEYKKMIPIATALGLRQ